MKRKRGTAFSRDVDPREIPTYGFTEAAHYMICGFSVPRSGNGCLIRIERDLAGIPVKRSPSTRQRERAQTIPPSRATDEERLSGLGPLSM